MNRCKGCDAPIVWGRTSLGHAVPLDPKPPVYQLTESGALVRMTNAMVSHFATCPKANDFSGSRRKAVTP